MVPQVDDDDLRASLFGFSEQVRQFLKDDTCRHILILKGSEGALSVWLKAPSTADKSNSFSFTKKEGQKLEVHTFLGATLMGVRG
jgi:hypothetical protein